MSISHRLEHDELSDTSLYELYSALGSRDTPRLFDRPYGIDTDHDVPTGGANTNDRKIKLIDRTLHRQVMDGRFEASGLSPDQIIDRWLDHEHCEKCIVDGDNPIDSYYPGHRRALAFEHAGVLAILGYSDGPTKLRRYEGAIWPALIECYHRPIAKPHPDMWCGPLADDPSDRDEEILSRLMELGVRDAAKRSKASVQYGMGRHNCGMCRMYSPDELAQERRDMAECGAVDGLVRWDRGCGLWVDAGRSKRAD